MRTSGFVLLVLLASVFLANFVSAGKAIYTDCVADSVLSSPTFDAAHACDGDNSQAVGGRWVASTALADHWLRTNLAREYTIINATVAWADLTSLPIYIQALESGTWVSHFKISTPVIPNSIVKYVLDVPTVTSSMRLLFASSSNAQVAEFSDFDATVYQRQLSGNSILILFLIGMLWLGFPIAGAADKNGFFVILGGIAGLAFAITAWTTTGDILSSTLLFVAAISTVAYSARVIMKERGPKE